MAVPRDTADVPIVQRLEWQAARTAIDASQAAHFAQHGRYRQVRRWSDAGDLAALGVSVGEHVRVAVDVYDGPSGRGFVLLGRYDDAGGTYERADHRAGPETWRSAGWRVVAEEQ